MIKKVFFLAWLILMVVVWGHAQSTRDVGGSTPGKQQVTKKSTRKGFFGFLKKNKSAFHKTGEEEVVDFRKRIKKVYKDKAKVERKMARPQYSDPAYFGHKRPPKKRPVDKRKFCKECGMTH